MTMKQAFAIALVAVVLGGCASTGDSAAETETKPKSVKDSASEVDPHQAIRSFFETCRPDAVKTSTETIEAVQQALTPCLDPAGLQQISDIGRLEKQQEFLKSLSGRFLATKSESGPNDEHVNVATCFEKSGKNLSTRFVLSSSRNDAKIRQIGQEVTACAPDMLMEDAT